MTIALPELVHWPSKTENGGRTTLIASTAEAVALGRNYIQTMRATIATIKADGTEKVQVTATYRASGKTRKKTLSIGRFEHDWQENFGHYETAVKEITLGNPELKHEISVLATKLMQMALDLQPSLNSSYCGFERWEDGDEVLLDLLREGDERPFLRRKRGEVEPRPGKGNGAYRIIINTDVAWWGRPEMNAAVMGALVLVLQQFAPVELWIQQGWLGGNEDDGVSLFKLDFNGSFDPTQLSFWCGSPFKDVPFSNFINRSIGREGSDTATYPELPCDLYLRGDWLTLYGVKQGFDTKSTQEQNQLAAAWIAATCAPVLYGETDDQTN